MTEPSPSAAVMGRRGRLRERLFVAASVAGIAVALGILCILLVDVFVDGLPRLGWAFLSNYPSRHAEKAGILAALSGTAGLMVLTGLISFPLGVGAGIYLEEYARKNRWSRLIELNMANLAGVPSIIYGLLGLGLFVRWLHLGRSLMAGALTLVLLILPVIVFATREAIRAVPSSLRDGSFALGATRWQTIRHQVLPVAMPGILTGMILALSRAIGETAPLITLGALTYVAFLPDSLLSPFTALPIQIFNWVSRPQKAFAVNAAAGIVVLLAMLVLMNAGALWLRSRMQTRSRL